MSVMTKEAAERLVKSGEYRWLSDEENRRLDGMGLDLDGDIDPYSGAVVFLKTMDSDFHFHNGIIANQRDITTVPMWNGIIANQRDITAVLMWMRMRHPE